MVDRIATSHLPDTGAEEIDLEIDRLARLVDLADPAEQTETDAIRTAFAQIVAAIHALKSDLASMQSHTTQVGSIPAAGAELDAVVDATETATHTIMTAAEALLAIDFANPADSQSAVNDQVMTIFEACSFQDITGQRISKVIATLNDIDARLGRFSGQTMPEPEHEERDQNLLNGPQLPGAGVSQDDVDDLMADADINQSIDALFAK